MPRYAYECADCGKRFTTQLTMAQHDRRHPKCPKCGSKHVRQKWETFFAVTAKKS